MKIFQLAKDFSLFFWERKIFWMTPVVITLVLLGVLIVVGSSSSLAPFIYTLF